MKEKCKNSDSITPYYPLPSNDGYENFLKINKKDMCKIYYYLDIRTQYSIEYLLSFKEKHKEKPKKMNDIILPKNKERARAKDVTEESFRNTRNYIGSDRHKNYKSNNHNYDNYQFLGDYYGKKAEINKMINELSNENYEEYLEYLKDYSFDEYITKDMVNIIFKACLVESMHKKIIFEIAVELCKTNNKKTTYKDVNFQSLLINKCKDEFKSSQLTIEIEEEGKNSNETKNKIFTAKLQNIKLIANLYLNNIILLSVIKNCSEELLIEVNDNNIRLLCELVKKIYSKLIKEDNEYLNKIVDKLESH